MVSLYVSTLLSFSGWVAPDGVDAVLCASCEVIKRRNRYPSYTGCGRLNLLGSILPANAIGSLIGEFEPRQRTFVELDI